MHKIYLCNKEYPCPCCGYMSFDEPTGSFDICQICFWEDDAVQLKDDWWDRGGANRPLRVEQWAYQRRAPIPPGGRAPRDPVEGDERDPFWFPLPEDPNDVVDEAEDGDDEDVDVDDLDADAFIAATRAAEGPHTTRYYWRWTDGNAPPRPKEFR